SMLSDHPYFRNTLMTSVDGHHHNSSLSMEERAVLAARASMFFRSGVSTMTTPTTSMSSNSSLMGGSSGLSAGGLAPGVGCLGNLGGLNPALSQLYSMGAARVAQAAPAAPTQPVNLPLQLWSQWAALHGLNQVNATILAHHASLTAAAVAHSTPSGMTANLPSALSNSVLGSSGTSGSLVSSASSSVGGSGTAEAGGVRLPRPVYPALAGPHRFAPYFHPKGSSSPTPPPRPCSPDPLRLLQPPGSPGQAP
ncbi:unnamed protein product, partial [Meganyctiphanes norvegica]